MGTRRRRVSVIYFISKLVKWDDLRMEIIINPTQDEIMKAAQALMDGHLVAFPTETVYGLGADATNEKAVSRVYAVKARPTDHPLIVHISSINQLGNWAIDIPGYAIKLAKEFWPGPMTLVLKRNNLPKNFITGGQDSVALRVPNQPLVFALLTAFESLGGQGVAAPSANRFGSISPTSADAVKEELGNFLSNDDYILNGGGCSIGIESTIIDCTKSVPTILRPGAVTLDMIEKTLTAKAELKILDFDTRTSGIFKSHYSPKAKVVLDVQASTGEGFIALKDVPTPTGVVRLASPASIEQFAAEMYEALRSGDQKGIKIIVVRQPIGNGLALAIRDRLTKASFE
jgi:L-threonylcarbamoyladenylate synthase